MKKVLPALLILVLIFAACRKDHTVTLTGQIGGSGDTLRILPASGTAGATVTIYGTKFGTATTGLSVSFNGVPADIRSVSNGEITVVVPRSTSGKIVVTSSDGKVTGPVFTYLPVATMPDAATVTALAPATGGPGTVVTITGTNFNTSGSSVTVLFNSVPASIQSVSATEIKVSAPATALTGPVMVKVGTQVIIGPEFTYRSLLNEPYNSGDITFKYQAEIDAFVAQNKGRSLDVTGGLSISGNDIVSLTGLSVIHSLSGGLNISYCPSLTDISLNEITSAKGLTLQNLNVTTIRLDGLKGKATLVWISACTNLTSISMKGLNAIGENPFFGSLRIENCPQLAAMDFSALTTADSFVTISGTGMTDLSKFNALRTAGSLVISGNPALASLRGLENLTTLSLPATIPAFNSTRFNGVNISNNAKLSSLSGLDNLVNVPLVNISGNPALNGFCPMKALITTLSTHADYAYQTPTRSDGVYRTDHVAALTLTGNGSYATTQQAVASLALCQ